MSYVLINANASVSDATSWTGLNVHALKPVHGRRKALRFFDPCWVCGGSGPGITELPDGRRVHRWPCRDRVA